MIVAAGMPASQRFEIMNCEPPEMTVTLRRNPWIGPTPHLDPRIPQAIPTGT